MEDSEKRIVSHREINRDEIKLSVLVENILYLHLIINYYNMLCTYAGNKHEFQPLLA